ncbi:hypothetical protein PR048_021127 [Dryococelus australis]|uniref:Uncharacterized protein n=1 Tax=Dryococelus australis TaxID=614101 RepID=A0ABQ9GXC5_9NEOP|nr:hypothetical protein PR048_021127 [Dryococelus australis]
MPRGRKPPSLYIRTVASCVNVEENRQLRLHSLLKPFDISSDCLFCGEEASQRKETKKSGHV